MKRIINSFLILCLLLGMQIKVNAESYITDSHLSENDLGSLCIELYFGTESKTEFLNNVTLNLVQVASLKEENQQLTYLSLSPFTQADINYSSLNTQTSKEAAYSLFEIVKASSEVVPEQSKTDIQGQATFKNLAPGAYLVYQTEKAPINSKYEMIEPFLVLVPELENDQWVFDITAEPKAGIVRIPTTSGSSLNTSTHTNAGLYEVLYILSAIMFIFLFIRFVRDRIRTAR